jgi:hypothetical protein
LDRLFLFSWFIKPTKAIIAPFLAESIYLVCVKTNLGGNWRLLEAHCSRLGHDRIGANEAAYYTVVVTGVALVNAALCHPAVAGKVLIGGAGAIGEARTAKEIEATHRNNPPADIGCLIS